MKQGNHSRALSKLKWLANLSTPKEGAEFGAARENLDYLPGDLSPWSARNFLRQIWHGGEAANELATMILSGQITLASTVNQMAKAIASRAESPLAAEAVRSYCQARVDWKRGELVYQWQNDFQKDLYSLLRGSHKAKICARPTCDAPYFVAKKKIQRYCGEECRDLAKQETQRDYWKRCGSMRRKQRKLKSKQKRRGH